jgi:hypothetical protein
VLFFNIAGYEYLPEKRVKGQIEDMTDIAQRIGLQIAKAIGKISAYELLTTVQHPSQEPYWKLRYKGACQDIFFLTIYDKLPALIDVMYNEADKAGYPTADIGIYLQPIVQGVNCHCEFNLFYAPDNLSQVARVKELANHAISSLMAKGAFFSRPYGENSRMIINRDAGTVEALRKVKSILDPDNVMNPGKLCF